MSRLTERAVLAVAAKSLEGQNSAFQIRSGGDWTATSRRNRVKLVKGMLSDCTRARATENPAIDSLAAKIDLVLAQSNFESALVDFKQGILSMDGQNTENLGVVDWVVKTLVSMTNIGKGKTTYVIVGIPDSEEDATRLKNLHGIDISQDLTTQCWRRSRIQRYTKSDNYLRKIRARIDNSTVRDTVKHGIKSSMRLVSYYGKTLLLLRYQSASAPEVYDGKYYVRFGSESEESRLKQQ